MVVDDSITIRKVTERILARHGLKVVTAKDGVDALKVLSKVKIDLIISDWNMPKMTGLELLQKVKGTPELAHIPFLMVTAEAENRHILEAIKAKVDQYMAGVDKKPFGLLRANHIDEIGRTHV